MAFVTRKKKKPERSNSRGEDNAVHTPCPWRALSSCRTFPEVSKARRKPGPCPLQGLPRAGVVISNPASTAALGTRPEEVTRTSLCGLAELPGAATPSRVPEDSHALASGKGIRTFFFSLRLLRFQTTWCGAHLCSLTRQGRGARRFSHPRLPAPVPLQAPRLLIDEPNATLARMCQTQHLEQPVPWRAGTGCKSVPKAPAGAARRRPTVGSGGVPEWSRGPRSQ